MDERIEVHLVTNSAARDADEVSRSALRIGSRLQALPGIHISLYVRQMLRNGQASPGLQCDLVDVQREVEKSYPPPVAGMSSPGAVEDSEKSVMALLALRNAIRSRMQANPAERHLVVSPCAVYGGIIAQRTAEDLGIPHIACMRQDTDLARHYYQRTGPPLFEYISRRAAWIVTGNPYQERRLREDCGRNGQITTIPESVECLDGMWSRRCRRDHVRLIADCGYANRKGTHLLVEAVGRLRAEGLDIRLSLAGPTDPAAPGPAYWAEMRKANEEADPAGFAFADVMAPEEASEFLLNGDIYCSPSVCEGVSIGPCRALAAGMPVVATGTRPEIDMAAGASHVVLYPPGDQNALLSAIGKLARALDEGRLEIDQSRVEEWRSELAQEREELAWKNTLREVLDHEFFRTDMCRLS